MPSLRKISHRTMADLIAARLKVAIEEGEFHENEQLPSVATLSRQFGVGRSSVREALKQLQALNLITIVHGKGTFVTRRKIETGTKFASFSEIIRERGMVPAAVTLSKDTIAADALVAVQLGLRAGTMVHYLKRLRLADGEPMAVEVSYLPKARFPDLLERYEDPGSLYELLEREYGTQLVLGSQTVEAVETGPEESELLKVKQNSPALFVETVAYDIEDVPVEYGTSLFRSDRYKFRVQLRR